MRSNIPLFEEGEHPGACFYSTSHNRSIIGSTMASSIRVMIEGPWPTRYGEVCQGMFAAGQRIVLGRNRALTRRALLTLPCSEAEPRT